MYQIIKAAERHPNVNTLPFRAIFAAYERILPENGLDPNHDQIYLRFLFRLGNNRERGQSLYESFEGLLEELGFQIEFVPDEDGSQGAAEDPHQESDGDAFHAQVRETRRYPKRSRRSSVSSAYDAGGERTEDIGMRPRSRASMSRLDFSQRSILETRPSTRATTRKTEKISHSSPSKLSKLQGERSRLTAEELAKSFQQFREREKDKWNFPDRKEHEHATSKEHTLQSPNDASQTNISMGDFVRSTIDVRRNSIEASVISHPVPQRYTSNPGENFYNPSRTQLLRDAETFYHYRIRSVARDAVDRWCFAALQAKNQHEHLERLAAARDTEILLRQAFEHWRLRLHAKKQAVATERYFKSEEKKIIRARDVMLLAKAFTHWAQIASDERLRTTGSRQKILSMKYFQAWRDITLSNQLSVRHQGLHKFFRIWRKRYARDLTDGIRAEFVRRETITRNAYWHWFWIFCDKRAPEWRAGGLRRKYLLQWVSAFKDNKRRQENLQLHIENSTQRRNFSLWLNKAQNQISFQHEAEIFSRRKRTVYTLQSWRQNWSYAPMYQQVSNMVDWRVAGATFAVFVARYRYERQAEAVNRLRTMRNVWTQWNDRLRWQTIARRLGDRYCLEALYRWVVSERYILLQRLTIERLKQRFLHRLKDECAARQSQRSHDLRLIEESQTKRLLQQCLVRWHLRLDYCHQSERVAFEFHAPKLAEDALQSWKRSLLQLQENNNIEKYAYPYFASRRFFKRWHAAFLESKRQKRKNAYIQVRREQKMSLARGALENWRSISAHVHQIREQADRMDQDRLLEFGAKLFDRWRSQADSIRDNNDRASQHYERRLLERHLYTWIEGLENQSGREEMAELNYDMRVKNVAFGWLNRLRLKIIELKGQDAIAGNLRNRYEKRHFRGILRHWHNATADNLNPQGLTTLSSRAMKTKPRGVADEGPTNQAEDWTDFDVGDWIPTLEAQSSTTPLPGYLSTPSKRAARARSLIKTSTTPAGTPFEQRLRSQLGSTPRTTRRSGFGRSTGALKGSTFSAILEDSPRTPNTRN